MSRARDLANSADNDITGTLTVDDITLSGNITVGGTVDGRDIATDGTKLDGIEANATADQTGAEIKAAYEGEADTNAFTDAEKTKLSGIEAGATADQTKADIDALNINADTLDGQHGSYYTSYADTAVANLVDTAPSTLDTLNELAAALGDDPNFSTTVTNNIATKLPLAGGTMTGAITFAAGQTFDGRDVSADGSKLDGIEAGATADQTASEILTAIKTVDGSGSGLDADTLDGLDSGSFLRSDANDTMSGSLVIQTAQDDKLHLKVTSGDTSDWNYISFYGSNGVRDGYIGTDGSGNMQFYQDSNGTNIDLNGSSPRANGYTIWHAGNDGSGSGLDADTLDGLQSSAFVRVDGSSTMTGDLLVQDDIKSTGMVRATGWHNTNTGTTGEDLGVEIGVSSGAGYLISYNRTGSYYGNLNITANNIDLTANNGVNSVTISGNKAWHAGNDGSGSGLDADTLDGSHASSFQTRSLTDSSRNINLLQSNGGGSAGIFLGDSNGSFRMQLYGDGSNYGFLNAKWGSWSLKVDSSSNLYMTGNVTAYSDERLKDNVVTIDNALDKVSAIRGVTYNRNDIEDAPRHAGVIAQEVEKVLPEVVQTDEDGIKTVAYGNMVGLLIEAIKEQQAQIDELKAKLGL